MVKAANTTRVPAIWEQLAEAIATAGTDRHIDTLIDAIGTDVAHDLVTVTRYSRTRTPEFVKHRRFSDEMVERYLAHYYTFDPFYAWWRRERRTGILPLRALADDEVKRGKYIAEFLASSENHGRGRHPPGGRRRLVPRNLSRPHDRFLP